MKSAEEIKIMIGRLKEAKPNVRPTTGFGDDNLQGVDAQIKVLEEMMDSDDIWDYWCEDEDDMHVRTYAEAALAWMDKECDDDLVDELPMM